MVTCVDGNGQDDEDESGNGEDESGNGRLGDLKRMEELILTSSGRFINSIKHSGRHRKKTTINNDVDVTCFLTQRLIQSSLHKSDAGVCHDIVAHFPSSYNDLHYVIPESEGMQT